MGAKEVVLRRMTERGFQRGLTGSRYWFIVMFVGVGARTIRRIGRRQEVLYRTVVKPGDRFEVTTKPRSR